MVLGNLWCLRTSIYSNSRAISFHQNLTCFSVAEINMKSVEWLRVTLVLWICILTVHRAAGFRVENRFSPYEKWLLRKKLILDENLQQQAGTDSSTSDILKSKRGCNGFPCMFTHMGGSAGNASLRKAKLSMLRECVSDPDCFSIGKRSSFSNSEYGMKEFLANGELFPVTSCLQSNVR